MRHRKSPYPGLTLALALLTAWPATARDDAERRSETESVDGRHRTIVIGRDGDLVRLPLELVSRSFLGVRSLGLTPQLRAHFGAPDDAGVMISEVIGDSPAAAAGLQVGDILTRAAGQRIASSGDLVAALRSIEPETPVTLEVWRDGETLTATAVLAEAERPRFDVSPVLHRLVERGSPLDVEGRELPQVDPERFEQAIVELRQRLASGEIERSIDRVRNERREMDARIRELETRLREMETELRRLADDDR